LFIEEADFRAPPEELFAAVSDRPGSFLLDSALPAGGLGAWSFIGFDPFLVFRAKGDEITLIRGGRTEVRRGDPLAELRGLLRRYGRLAAERRELAGVLPFSGGAVGYFSYELCARLERIPRTSVDDAPTPDMEFGFYDGIIAYEHAAQKYFLAANPVDEAGAGTIFERLKVGRRVPSSRSFAVTSPTTPFAPDDQKSGQRPLGVVGTRRPTNGLGTSRSTSDKHYYNSNPS